MSYLMNENSHLIPCDHPLRQVLVTPISQRSRLRFGPAVTRLLASAATLMQRSPLFHSVLSRTLLLLLCQ